MNSKVTDRIATGVFGLIAAVITAILVGLFSYIIINGFSHISIDFLTSRSSALTSGGGIRDQLVLYFGADHDHYRSARSRRRYLYG